MSDDGDKEYTVGYGKPPKAGRFKPGQSGNPKGRTKGAKNFITEIQQELSVRIPITENGKRKTISKRKAIAKQLVNKAVTGDAKATPVLLNELRPHEAMQEAANKGQILNTTYDEMTMGSILLRIMKSTGSASADRTQALDESSSASAVPDNEREPSQ